MQKSGKPATSRTKVRADKWSHGKADLMKTTDWQIPMYYYHGVALTYQIWGNNCFLEQVF